MTAMVAPSNSKFTVLAALGLAASDKSGSDDINDNDNDMIKTFQCVM